jgi:hypothetical protein
MNQPNKLSAVLIATSIMLLISLFPGLNIINLFCCAGIIAGGAGGTLYYIRASRRAGLEVANRDGLMIGLLSGIISAIIYVIASTLIIMYSSVNPVEMVYKFAEDYGIEIPPESENLLKMVYDDYQRQGFSFLMIGIELFTRIISHCTFGAAGGLLTVSIYNKRMSSRSTDV